jgi:stearoyl-CoA desaturase (delta-9 desaturase)
MLWAIVGFFVGHWVLSVFFQTFFLHRYGAHRMFTMSKGWERVFHVLTWICQGASYLNPRAYAILHREHHAFSDTARDPHSPHTYPSFFAMMWATKNRYHGILNRSITPEARFEGGYPEWAWVDRVADSWVSRLAFGAAYTGFYLAFAPHWAFLLLLPIHYLMGPIHGAIVNWGGHKYGYRNFDTDDKSVNSLPFDFLTGGELFQNNHHKYGMAPNFAARWFELDPSYQVIRVLSWLRVIEMPNPQKMKWSKKSEIDASSLPQIPMFGDAE